MMSSNGQRLNGLVLEINEEIIKMDFNHPLAGEDLFFAGKVVGVRQASEEEVAQLLSGGGCGCGDGGGCGTESCDTEGEAGGCGSGCGC
jgi:FKBP-type peptidyl-prolyl cis-trans isomerase SlyD